MRIWCAGWTGSWFVFQDDPGGLTASYIAGPFADEMEARFYAL